LLIFLLTFLLIYLYRKCLKGDASIVHQLLLWYDIMSNDNEQSIPCCENPTIINDNGIIVCRNCGTVIDAENISFNFENVYNEKDKYYDTVGAPSYSNRTTFIPNADYRGVQLNGKSKALYTELIQVHNTKTYTFETTLKKAKWIVRDIKTRLYIKDVIEQDVYKLCVKVIKMKYHIGYALEDVCSAIFIYICKSNNLPIFFNEIEIICHINMEKLQRFYNKLLQEILPKFNILTSNNISISKYCEAFSNNLNIPFVNQKKIEDLSLKIEKCSFIQGRDPKGIASAILYHLCKSTDNKLSQKKICGISFVSEVTLRNSLKLLLVEINKMQKKKKKSVSIGKGVLNSGLSKGLNSLQKTGELYATAEKTFK